MKPESQGGAGVQNQWPPSIILRISDLMVRFEHDARDYVFQGDDYAEIVRQIFGLLLNFGPAASTSYANLPDTSRLVGEMGLDRASPRWAGLNQACAELARGIHARVEEYQIWRTHPRGKDCPYYFDGFIGRDVLLDYMPY